MKKLIGVLAVIMMVMGCGSPAETEYEIPYDVECSVSYTLEGRVCNLSWDVYDNEDFLAYVVAFEESSTGWMITEDPIMNREVTQCYSFPDIYEGHNIDNLYFRIVSEDSILVDVEFDI